MIAVLTGSHLFHAFHEGSLAVIRQKDTINRMNVFPVPDGDTGSNLSSTLKSGIDHAQHHDSFGKTLKSIAENLLMGARGNSGLLFAQFINGLADAIGDAARVEKQAFVTAVNKAVASTYASISTPVEGTILTVMREWAEKLDRDHHEHKDILSLLKHGMDGAQESLRKTKEKLAVLQKANTIDAGAKGFVEFLGGFVSSLTHHGERHHGANPDTSLEDAKALEALRTEEEKDEDNHVFDLEGGIASIPQRFCTECIITGENLDPDAIRHLIGDLGDSLIAAGSHRAVRIHIHTNLPQEVFARLADQGLVAQQKADDMHTQFLITSRQHSKDRISTGLLTDTTCDIPDDLALKHRIVMVPLSVGFGEQSWLDRYTLDSKRFFRLMKEKKDFPVTSQPSPGLIRKTYQFMLSHFDHVIANHISSGLSGTSQSSSNEARVVDASRISVVPSRLTSAALGLCLLRCAEDLESGIETESAKTRLATYQKNASFAVMVPKMDNFLRGGRVSKSQARLAGLLHLKPLVTTDQEGKAHVPEKGLGLKGAEAKILRQIKECLKHGPIHSWAIAHGMADEKTLAALSAKVEKLAGKPPVFIGPLSPVLGTHGGPGAINVAWLPE